LDHLKLPNGAVTSPKRGRFFAHSAADLSGAPLNHKVKQGAPNIQIDRIN